MYCKLIFNTFCCLVAGFVFGLFMSVLHNVTYYYFTTCDVKEKTEDSRQNKKTKAATTQVKVLNTSSLNILIQNYNSLAVLTTHSATTMTSL